VSAQQFESPFGARAGDAGAVFLATVAEELDYLGIRGDRVPDANGELRLTFPGQAPDCHVAASVDSLAHDVAGQPESEWAAIIRRHFAVGAAAVAGWTQPVPAAEAFAGLRVRLHPSGYAGNMPTDGLLKRPAAERVDRYLCLDRPTTITSVTRTDLERWQLSEDEAWARAVTNTRREPLVQVTHKVAGKTAVTVWNAENFYVTSHVLWLPDVLAVDARRGAIVALPTRELAMVCSVRGRYVPMAMSMMASRGQAAYQAGPRGLASALYWWHDGALDPTPIVPDPTCPPEEWDGPAKLQAILRGADR